MNGAYLYSVEKTYLAFIEAQGPAVPTRYIYNASSKALIIERISTDPYLFPWPYKQTSSQERGWFRSSVDICGPVYKRQRRRLLVIVAFRLRCSLMRHVRSYQLTSDSVFRPALVCSNS